MDYKEEVRDIHNRRESRKRKKILKQILFVIAVLLIIAVVIIICSKPINQETANNENDMTLTETTAAPTVIPETTPKPTAAPTQEPTPVPTVKPVERRGVWEAVPDDVKSMMSGCSLPKNASVTFDNLAYLTIPYYDFNYNVAEGHMIVNAKLADEVLDIFAELFDIKYPIERMQLVDYYNADDYTSIEHNNTSAFNYRESTDGSGRLSKHALGCAIDINPQINPYVNSDGVGSHQNAREYWSRNTSAWSSNIAKAAYIGTNTEIYKIFVNKYGWEWGGSWSSYRDYQHFQKSI